MKITVTQTLHGSDTMPLAGSVMGNKMLLLLLLLLLILDADLRAPFLGGGDNGEEGWEKRKGMGDLFGEAFCFFKTF